MRSRIRNALIMITVAMLHGSTAALAALLERLVLQDSKPTGMASRAAAQIPVRDHERDLNA